MRTAALSLLVGFVLLAASSAVPGSERVLADFTTGGADLGWYIVNDDVMGGRSEGGFEIADGTLRFSGRTNTDGGGFSSIRTKPLRLDLSDHAGIRLKVRGDGRRYTWRLATTARWRGRQVAYWADFDTLIGTWSSVDIPFSSFIPRFRGVRLDGPVLDPGEIRGMGLMIYDEQDGPFELHLASVRAYSATEPFGLEQYRWKKRLLVISAPADNDEGLRAQRAGVISTGEEFDDRDMILVSLLSDGASTAGGRKLDPADAARIRTDLGLTSGSFSVTLIGKDGSVKLSSETVVPMTKVYALIDSMPMRQREMADCE